MSRSSSAKCRIVVVALLCSGLSAASASAQMAQHGAPLPKPISDLVAAAAATASVDADQSGASQAPEAIRKSSRPSPALMTALHATTITSHVLDVHSTMRALDRGAVERNPLMFGLSKNRAALIGVKTALGAGTIFATHKIAQRSKVAAILAVAAVNSVILTAAHHNYKVARTLQ